MSDKQDEQIIELPFIKSRWQEFCVPKSPSAQVIAGFHFYALDYEWGPGIELNNDTPIALDSWGPQGEYRGGIYFDTDTAEQVARKLLEYVERVRELQDTPQSGKV